LKDSFKTLRPSSPGDPWITAVTAARGRFEVGLSWKDGGLAASALVEFAAAVHGWAACIDSATSGDVRLLPGNS